jgi:hypothetical protein
MRNITPKGTTRRDVLLSDAKKWARGGILLMFVGVAAAGYSIANTKTLHPHEELLNTPEKITLAGYVGGWGAKFVADHKRAQAKKFDTPSGLPDIDIDRT